MDTVIETLNLVKRYSTQPQDSPSAINAIDMSVGAGQLYGLIGPDGAGKTTLLRILATVMEPTSGSARLAGFDTVKQAEDVRARLGYMPQAFSLYPDLSVMENLRFFADINNVPRAKQKPRIDELLEFARLTDFTTRRSENLSGGMRKKLALACSLIHEPEILLLDEPTTGVDPVSRRELWQLLAKVIQQGVTVLVSTPYMDEAERCKTVSIIYRGHLLTTGAPAELERQMPFHIIEVKAQPRRILRTVADGTKGVIGWRAVGDRLRLLAENPGEVIPRIEKALNKEGATISILREARMLMEDVFIHLVEKQESRA
ncbi:MAG TPA: ABC transporter ATP-binding protein [Anaerolineales bacterium]|jgi:ABC-2 type transport system ATP-binding protein|nr:ABC transporter ATP-binding protein [Anaerolineales bacterium]HMZ06230.1 ABC transporter ATP-binding protein [Anaerolineales bacterium]HNA87696.1 ABC transporter ATP-binding protein [Anaerolineales bacterium]HNB34653.1 ABC transporter ATP-binding protein [Anaerolineales bacterium]HNC07314.1 ABC transporter ATP-binding protein [Anaerolineales bacterium]